MTLIMKISIVFLLSLFFVIVLNAEEVSLLSGMPEISEASVIRGKVIEDNSGESLMGVEIEILGTEIATFTNMEGEFELKGLNAHSEYAIRISYISYKNKIIRGVNPGMTEVIIRLQNQGVGLNSNPLNNHPDT